MDPELDGSHIFVTGASGGIGLETAEQFLQEGARVTLHYNSNKNNLSELLEEYPERTYSVQADVLNEEDVLTAVQAAVVKFGHIHTIVINHGIWPSEDIPIWEMTTDRWNKTIAVNQTGSFFFAREYTKQLRNIPETEKNIGIIFIGSTAGKFGEADHSDYAGTKAALMYGLTRSLKNEIIRLHPNARVNAIMPGWVLTEMAKEGLEDEVSMKKVLQTIPLNKVGRPEDIASSAVFLASEKLSGHISGNIVDISGGMEGRVLRD